MRTPNQRLILSVVALAVVSVAWAMVYIYTGGFSEVGPVSQVGEDYPGAPVSLRSRSVTGVTPEDGFGRFEYNFFGIIRKLQNIDPGFDALILDTTDSGVPIFAIVKDTKIEKTKVDSSSPAKVSDLKEGLNVSVTAVFSVAEKKWTTQSVLIPVAPEASAD